MAPSPPPRKKPTDISGHKFGALTPIDYRPADGKWRCACECGGETYRRLCDLRSNLRRNCKSSCERCRIFPAPKHRTTGYKLPNRLKDLVGKKFGLLTVISLAERSPSGARWNCSCDCGSGINTNRSAQELTRINNPGCRDCEGERRSAVHLTHGGAYGGVSRLYAIWKAMHGRCRDVNNPHYGGKGITVCPEWADFRVFRHWAQGERYENHLTIDRLDPSKGYFPMNCEWVTREENSRRVHNPKMVAA